MKKFLIGSTIIILLGLVIFISKFPNNTITPSGNGPKPTETIVGGDKDKNGCIASAGYTWCGNKNKCIRPWEEQCGTDEEEISKVVDGFYKSYYECMSNPPVEAKGMVGEYCQNNTGFSSSSFMANLDKGGTAKHGADPIVCAQNMPERSGAAKNITVNSDKATATIDEMFGKLVVNPEVQFIKENNLWKVNNVVCPTP